MFEVKETDLAARIGRLRTKSGYLETPALLPVIHPTSQLISAARIKEIGFQAVMTNAYIAMKVAAETGNISDIHEVIGFDGIVMTDSGGYQVLRYGDVDANPKQIARFEEEIDTDIAVILDRPTGFDVSKRFASESVRRTLEAAKETLPARRRRDILWTGPIQGGKYTDLVRKSAIEMAKLDFDLFALGSPTEVMEGYHFSTLVSMIMAAKRNLPVSKPLHLFGAGHTLTIPLAVALGCDLFDSASYILYARALRYIGEQGTMKLQDMTYGPCNCPICSKYSPKEMLKARECQELLSLHNLYMLKEEMDRAKEAIAEGRLWEYLSSKARSHPRLWDAFKKFGKLRDYLEDGTPLFKSKSIFMFDSTDLARPEVQRSLRMLSNVTIPKERDFLLIVKEDDKGNNQYLVFANRLLSELGDLSGKVHIAVYSDIFGLIPLEIAGIYPLSQNFTSSFIKKRKRMSLDAMPTRGIKAGIIIKSGKKRIGYWQVPKFPGFRLLNVESIIDERNVRIIKEAVQKFFSS